MIRETWTYVRRRPHYGFSLAPVNAGVLLLTPSMIEVALRAMDVIADDAVPAWLLVFTQMLGGVCILASIPLFVFFELRTQRVAPTPRGGDPEVYRTTTRLLHGVASEQRTVLLFATAAASLVLSVLTVAWRIRARGYNAEQSTATDESSPQ